MLGLETFARFFASLRMTKQNIKFIETKVAAINCRVLTPNKIINRQSLYENDDSAAEFRLGFRV